MKQSARAKRLAKHHKRFNSAPKLNLVSLMDIFTILVFFPYRQSIRSKSITKYQRKLTYLYQLQMSYLVRILW